MVIVGYVSYECVILKSMITKLIPKGVLWDNKVNKQRTNLLTNTYNAIYVSLRFAKHYGYAIRAQGGCLGTKSRWKTW